VESLRSDPRTANVVAVAVTVLDDPGILETLLARGFDGYLRKPFDTSRFTEELVPLARRRARCG
jgi:CheY-like chemotaxis protein